MKIKTSDLTDRALDWAAAKALGLNPNTDPEVRRQYVGYPGFAEANGFGHAIKNYSGDWSQGGPIIERDEIRLDFDVETRMWLADAAQSVSPWQGSGPTPLIAAMRCFVASKLGDEVDIPDELCK